MVSNGCTKRNPMQKETNKVNDKQKSKTMNVEGQIKVK